MQQELADRLGAYDQAVSADATKLKRWLNMGYQYICGKAVWPFLVDYEIVQTVTDITTGTVSISAGDTAMTFSSAPTVSVANRYIQLSTSSDWYKITSHTASSTSATISPAYVGTSALSGGTYTVRKLLYTTTTPFSAYLDIKKTVNAAFLGSLSRRAGDFILPLFLGTGNPTTYIMGPLDSSGNLQFSLANPPNSILNLLVRGLKAITELSGDTDTPIFPAKWHDAVVDFGAHYGFMGLDDTRAADSFKLGDAKVQDMMRVYDPDLGRLRVMSAVDSGYVDGPVFTLPSDFGSMGTI